MHRQLPQLVDEKALAAMLDVSVRTVRKWRLAGTGIPFCKLGKLVRYDMADVEAVLARSRRSSTTASAPPRARCVRFTDGC